MGLVVIEVAERIRRLAREARSRGAEQWYHLLQVAQSCVTYAASERLGATPTSSARVTCTGAWAVWSARVTLGVLPGQDACHRQTSPLRRLRRVPARMVEACKRAALRGWPHGADISMCVA